MCICMTVGPAFEAGRVRGADRTDGGARPRGSRCDAMRWKIADAMPAGGFRRMADGGWEIKRKSVGPASCPSHLPGSRIAQTYGISNTSQPTPYDYATEHRPLPPGRDAALVRMVANHTHGRFVAISILVGFWICEIQKVRTDARKRLTYVFPRPPLLTGRCKCTKVFRDAQPDGKLCAAPPYKKVARRQQRRATGGAGFPASYTPEKRP